MEKKELEKIAQEKNAENAQQPQEQLLTQEQPLVQEQPLTQEPKQVEGTGLTIPPVGTSQTYKAYEQDALQHYDQMLAKGRSEFDAQLDPQIKAQLNALKKANAEDANEYGKEIILGGKVVKATPQMRVMHFLDLKGKIDKQNEYPINSYDDYLANWKYYGTPKRDHNGNLMVGEDGAPLLDRNGVPMMDFFYDEAKKLYEDNEVQYYLLEEDINRAREEYSKRYADANPYDPFELKRDAIQVPFDFTGISKSMAAHIAENKIYKEKTAKEFKEKANQYYANGDIVNAAANNTWLDADAQKDVVAEWSKTHTLADLFAIEGADYKSLYNLAVELMRDQKNWGDIDKLDYNQQKMVMEAWKTAYPNVYQFAKVNPNALTSDEVDDIMEIPKDIQIAYDKMEKYYQKVNANSKGFWGGVFSGFADTFFDKNYLSLGMGGRQQADEIERILKKNEEDRTPAEKVALSAFILNETTQTKNWAYSTLGVNSAYSVREGILFYLTGGWNWAVKGGRYLSKQVLKLVGGGRATTRWLVGGTQEFIKNSGGFRNAARSLWAEKSWQQIAAISGKWAGWNISHTLYDGANAQLHAFEIDSEAYRQYRPIHMSADGKHFIGQNLIDVSPKVIEENRKHGETDNDVKARLYREQAEWETWWDKFIESNSETSGVVNMIGRLSPQWRLLGGPLGAFAQKIETQLAKFGVGSILVEGLEEVEGQAKRTLGNLYTAFDEKGINHFNNLDWWRDTGASVVFNCVALRGASAVPQVADHWKNHNEKQIIIEEGNKLLGEEFDRLRGVIDNSSIQGCDAIIKSIANDKTFTDDQKKILYKYITNKAEAAGMNLARVQALKLGLVSQEQLAYDEGYTLAQEKEGAALHNVKVEYEDAAKELAEVAGVDVSEDALASANAAIGKLEPNRGSMTNEQRKAFNNYLYAKNKYEGMLAGVDAKARAEQGAAVRSTDMLINPETGEAIEVKLVGKGATGYIVAGNVATGSNGNIDTYNSSKSVVVLDPETGKTEMVSIKDVESVVSRETATAVKEKVAESALADSKAKYEAAINEIEMEPSKEVVAPAEPIQPMAESSAPQQAPRPVATNLQEQRQLRAQEEEQKRQKAQEEKVAQEKQMALEKEAQAIKGRVQPRKNDEFSLLDQNGNEVTGFVFSEPTENGYVAVVFDTPYNGRTGAMMRVDAFKNALVSFNGRNINEVAQSRLDALNERNRLKEEAKQARDVVEEARPKDQPAQVPTQTPTPTAEVPAEKSPKDVVDEIENSGLTQDETTTYIDNHIAKAEADLKAAQANAPKIELDMQEYLALKNEWRQEVEAAEKELEYWQSAKSEYEARGTKPKGPAQTTAKKRDSAEDIEAYVDELSDQLNYPVHLAHSIDEVKNPELRKALEEGKDMDGAYNPKTGEIEFYLPNISDMSQVQGLFLHELAAHHGVKQLLNRLGLSPSDFYELVWNSMSPMQRSVYRDYPGIREKTTEEAIHRGAADEFVANVGTRMGLNQELRLDEKSTWEKIVDEVTAFLNEKTDVQLKIRAGMPINEEDISDLLTMSAKEFAKSKANSQAEQQVEAEESKYSFIGEKGATNLDAAEEATVRMDNLAIAREMESAGKDAQTIKMATGWERGADTKWRYEVEDIFDLEDVKAKITEELKDSPKTWGIVYPDALGEVVKQYPDFNVDIMVWVGDEYNNEGSYSPAVKGDEQSYGTPPQINVYAKTVDDIDRILVHEIQHYIQEREGFAAGGNMASANKKIEEVKQILGADEKVPFKNIVSYLEHGFETPAQHEAINEIAKNAGYENVIDYVLSLAPYSYYSNLAGEVEARNVSRRMAMTSMEQRRKSLRTKTQDVADADQIFIYDALEGASEADGASQVKSSPFSSWLTQENIEWAEGRNFEEIEERFGNELVPIATIPHEVALYFGLADENLHSGKAYFIDHAANHHPEVTLDEYEKIQEVIEDYDDIKDLSSDKQQKVAFIKKLNKGYAVVAEVSKKEDKLLLHKTFFYKDSKGTRVPYKNKPSLKNELPVDGSTTISPIKSNSRQTPNISALGDSTDKGNKSDVNQQRNEEEKTSVEENLTKGDDPTSKAENTRFSIANRNQVGFVSNAARAVESIKQEKATPSQWLAMIQKQGGLKTGEDKWLGLSEWLKGSDAKTLTKDEVLEFIGENMIQIEEVNYTETADSFNELKEEYETLVREEGFDAANEEMTNRYGDDFYIAFEDLGGELTIANEEAAAALLGSDNIINRTRLDYTTEGLTNKREIALTVPTVESWNSNDEIHFGDAGDGRAVAWIRFGETFAYDVIDDVQVVDDFHAPYENISGRNVYKPIGGSARDYVVHGKGRNGEMIYVVYINEKALPVAHATLEDARIAMNEYYKEHPRKLRKPRKVLVIDEIQSKRHQEGREKGYKRKEDEEIKNKQGTAIWEMMRKYNVSRPADLQNLISSEDAAYLEEVYGHKVGEIPDAPFDKNWHELAMKRMLRYAAENGFDKVAWTKGEQQAKRYDMVVFVNRISSETYGFDDNNNPTRLVQITLNGEQNDIRLEVDKDGIIVDGEREYEGKHLGDVVGKDLAKKLMDHDVVVSGDNLYLGAEGMKGFYDKMLPSFLNKYGKKWGVKVGEIELPEVEEDGRTMWAIDVTPEMKESVGEQTMFSVSPNSLVGLHNLTEANLAHVAKMGGIANPSMAVVNSDIATLDNFGEITLIAPRDLIDKKGGKNAGTWGADAYSPRYPKVEYVIPYKKQQELQQRAIDAGANRYEAAAFVQRIEDSGKKWLNGDRTVLALFNKEGRDGESVEAYIDRLVDEVVDKEQIFIDYTDNGRKYAKHTLANVSRIMKKEGRAGAEGNYVLGSVRAKITPIFKTIAQIQKNKSRIVSAEEWKQAEESMNERYYALANEIGYDELGEALLERDPKGYLDREYDIEITNEEEAQIKQLAADLAVMPTEYFETKFERPVMLNEFVGAIIPKSASERTRSILNEAGIPFEEYDGEKVGDRLRVVQEFTKGLEEKEGGVRFSNVRTSEEIEKLFNDAVSGNLSGESVPFGSLTKEGKAYLESLSGLKFKDEVDFVLNPSDMVHVYNDHFGDNEKDKGKNIPLNIHDIKRIVDVVSYPDEVLFGIEEKSGRKMFYFLMDTPNGAYNLLEVYANRKGNLTAKTYYKTKKDATQRVMDLKRSLLPTSETYSGAILSYAKVPQMFDSKKFEEGKITNSPSKITAPESLAPLAEELGVELGELDGKKSAYKDGKVVVDPSAHQTMAEAEQTLVKESLTHQNLNDVMGEAFPAFISKAYKLMPDDLRKLVSDAASKNGWDVRKATEEVLGEMAKADELGAYAPFVKKWMVDALKEAGLKDITVETLNDADLRYILWRNGKNQTAGAYDGNLLNMAEDIATRRSIERSEEPSTMFSYVTPRQLSDDYKEATARVVESYDDVVGKTSAILYEAWVDYLSSVKKMQDVIERELGIEIADAENVYLHMQHKSSIDGAEYDRIRETLMIPMMDINNRILKKTGWSQEELDRYLILKHGLERNIEFALRDAKAEAEKEIAELKKELDKAVRERRIERNKVESLYKKGLIDDATRQNNLAAVDAMYNPIVNAAQQKYNHASSVNVKNSRIQKLYNENRLNDYSGLTAAYDWGKNPGISLADVEQEVEQEIADTESIIGDAMRDELWNAINDLSDYTLTKAYTSGMLDEEMYNYLNSRFQYYVPLKGFQEETAEDLYTYMGSGKVGSGKPLQKAGGRTSFAADPLTTMMADAHNMLVKANKNKAKQALLNLANRTQSEMGLLTVTDSYYEKRADGFYYPVPSPDLEGKTAEEAAQLIEDWKNDMETKLQNGDVVKRSKNLDAPIRVADQRNENEHMVKVLVDGVEKIVWVNGNPKVAQAINGQLNPDSKKGPITNWLEEKQRFIAKNVTANSPSFIVSNMRRDMKGTLGYIFATRGAKAAAMFEKNWLINFGGGKDNIKNLYNMYWNGTLDPQNNIRHQYFQEFIENGGQTGYSNVWSLEEYKKDVQKMAEEIKKNPHKVFEYVRDGVEHLNKYAENMSRFATYVTMRESGESVLKSIHEAKEGGTNFNRKGSGAYGNQLARSVFMFMNPAIQGVQQMLRVWAENPVRATSLYGSQLLAGIGVAALNILAWGDGDDDEKDYYNLSSYVRKNNVMLRVSDTEYIKIPLAQTDRLWYGVGEWIGSAIWGGKHQDLDKELVDHLAQVLPIDIDLGLLEDGKQFDPLTTIAGILRSTGFGPVFDVVANKDFTGGRVHGGTPFNEDLPGWAKAKADTPTWMVNAARWLNNPTNSHSDFRKGAININPASAHHIASGYLGGMWDFFAKVVSTATSPFSDDPDQRNNPRNYLLAGQFVASTNSEYAQNVQTNAAWDWYMIHYNEAKTVSDADRKAAENPRQSDGVKERASQHYQEFLGEEEHTLLVTMKPYVDKVQDLYSKWKIAPDAERREITKQMNALKRECVGILDKGTPWEGDNSYADEVFIDVNRRQNAKFAEEYKKAVSRNDSTVMNELLKDTASVFVMIYLDEIDKTNNAEKDVDKALKDGYISGEEAQEYYKNIGAAKKGLVDSLRSNNKKYGK